ncbi:MAG TPA: AAA family ATPase [Longimicrobiales bacterium]|nr:AAA family ATPase [Longimicrobiales bacterium]
MTSNASPLDPLEEFSRRWGNVERVRARSVVDHPGLTEAVRLLRANLERRPPRSSLLVGPPGVGKTACVLRLFEELREDGWTVFEATASDLMAGQSFIGQIDERISVLVRAMESERKSVWYCPGFHELLPAARHISSPVGVLEMLLPHMDRGAVRIVGETTAAAYEQMLRLAPTVGSRVEAVRVESLTSGESLELALSRFAEGERTPIPRDVVVEAGQLADQFLPWTGNPGRLIELLDATRRRCLAEGARSGEMTLDDVLTTLSARSGLPVQLLDEREQLDLAEVRDFFSDRILGQPEAVQAVVERIALTKAALVDPSRPLGVFLFVGPTGTGKTEIAKTLAEYLFGSRDHMIRLDMSEFKESASLDRLLGERGSVADPQSLVARIRHRPFSVVLLDEFEKADPQVWDVFLQVFDDGRLTARDGTTGDFRSSIVILTSNLGAADSLPSGLGFGSAPQPDGASRVDRVLARTFRPEFLNRLDRVVHFRPLSRPVMRTLLDLELKSVYERRGLRRKGWAIEWDEAAVEFLIDRGFSPTLGARPLKRAVETWFLAPLAAAIVEHRAPTGEQFLFVRLRDGRLEVEFVDPDAPSGPERRPAATRGAAGGEAPRLEEIARSGVGGRDEMEVLVGEYDALASTVADVAWEDRKTRLLVEMSDEGFWQREDRFFVLGRAEYRDRIEAGLRTAGSLLHRLDQASSPPRDLVRRLAEQLYLVREAIQEVEEGTSGDAFLEILPGRDPRHAEESATVVQTLADMYRSWAARRRMKVRELASGVDAASPRVLLAVSGFGARRILTAEAGTHVFEPASDDGLRRKVTAHVRVAPQPDHPLPEDARAMRVALQHLEAASPELSGTVVRRYRYGPSPRVKDLVRGWTTGNIDDVLGGDFDLL